MSSTQQMIAVLGGTGGIGSKFIPLALERGHSIRMLARTPSKIPDEITNHERVTVIQGDSTILDDVKKLIQGGESTVDLVISSVGNPNPKVHIMAQTAKNIVATKPKRIIAISSLGMNGTSPTIKFILSLIAGKVSIEDYEEADKVFRDYNAEHGGVVIRPDGLSDANGNGAYNATKETGMGRGSLPKADVALCLADLITDTQYGGGDGIQLYAKKK